MRTLTPRGPDWAATAPLRITRAELVPASPQQVFAVLADHERWPTWFTGVRSVEVNGPREGVGARRRVSTPGLVIDEEFVTWEPGSRFGFTVLAMSRPVATSFNEDVRLTDAGQGRTRVEYTIGLEPAGPLRVGPVGRLFATATGRSLGRALVALGRRAATEPV